MRFKSILAAIAIMPLFPAAAEPLRLQPSSPWDVDYAENSCRLIRVFGSGERKTVLMFESGAPGEMDMLVVGNLLSSSRDKLFATFLPMASEPIGGDVVQNGPAHTPGAVWPQVRLLSDETLAKLERKWEEHRSEPGVRPPAFDPIEAAAEIRERQAFAAQATELEIGPRRDHPVILETGSLGEPIRMFDKCNHDSLSAWGGVDPTSVRWSGSALGEAWWELAAIRT